MTDANIDNVLNIFNLNDKQRTAATEFQRDVVVTAGAGSGKTSTLVARYVCLLAKGVSPRRIAAITFTKKAAREMRSRVRGKLIELQQLSDTEEKRQKWMDLSSRMDSARIGTIRDREGQWPNWIRLRSPKPAIPGSSPGCPVETFRCGRRSTDRGFASPPAWSGR